MEEGSPYFKMQNFIDVLADIDAWSSSGFSMCILYEHKGNQEPCIWPHQSERQGSKFLVSPITFGQ